MTQMTYPLETAKGLARSDGRRALVYHDPEIGLYGWYALEDMEPGRPGEWVPKDLIVWDTDEDTEGDDDGREQRADPA